MAFWCTSQCGHFELFLLTRQKIKKKMFLVGRWEWAKYIVFTPSQGLGLLPATPSQGVRLRPPFAALLMPDLGFLTACSMQKSLYYKKWHSELYFIFQSLDQGMLWLQLWRDDTKHQDIKTQVPAGQTCCCMHWRSLCTGQGARTTGPFKQ